MNVATAQTIFQHHRMAYITTDCQLRVCDIGGCVELVSIEPAVATRQSLIDVVPELAEHTSALKQLLRDETPFVPISISRTKHNGQRKPISVHTIPYYNQTGTICGLIITLADATSTDGSGGRLGQQATECHGSLCQHYSELAHQKERLEHQNQQHEQAAYARNNFLSLMSHKLRTPLTAILGFAEALNLEVFGPLNSDQHKRLLRIERNGEQLLALITNVLDLIKIESGNLSLDIESVAVSEVCEQAVRASSASAANKHVQVDVVFDPRVTLIEADGHRLRQILVNLLANAVQASPDHGTVKLRVQSDAGQRYVRFAICDAGNVMTQEELDRAFYPFALRTGSLATQRSDHGVELAMSRYLTELHGGELLVQRDIKCGNCFTVLLPTRVEPTSFSSN